jgi:TonB family protein
MNDHWKQWEGQVVNGKFPLSRFLGGSEHSGVFLVDKSAGRNLQAAIKLVVAASVDANDQLRQWRVAADLDHPNVIRVLESGRCELDGDDFLYVLMECAEEDLSQILPQRPLTEEETRQVLEAVLKGLAYIHAKGLVHGRVRPSNILAGGDVVKISSDSLRAAGRAKGWSAETSVYDAPETETGHLGPSADVWSLGVTLVEVLTQQLPVLDSVQGRELPLPAGMPGLFQEIARGCLQIDPQNRWTVAKIAARLKTGPQGLPSEPVARAGVAPGVTPSAAEEKKSAKWVYALAFVAVVAIAAVLMLKPKPSGSSMETRTGMSAPSEPSASTTSPIEARQVRSEGEASGEPSESAAAEPGGDVVWRVMPRVSPGARNTITGKVRVVVKMNVDATGNVTEAQLQSPGPSKYFARMALEAARGWKFKPAMANGRAVASQWVVRFGFSRSGTEASAKRAAS